MSIKLYYFDAYGRGEQFRLLLNHAGVEFEDVRIKGEEWPEYKKNHPEKFEYGQMPALEKDGKFYSQSGAILRLLGREYGYYPSDSEDAYQVDKLLELLTDFALPIMKVHFNKNEEEKKTQFADLVENHFPKFFGLWEKQLTNNTSQSHLYGDAVTIADFAYTAVYGSFINNGAAKDTLLGILDNYPTTKAYFNKRIEEQQDYFDNRPVRPF